MDRHFIAKDIIPPCRIKTHTEQTLISSPIVYRILCKTYSKVVLKASVPAQNNV